jgi:aspartyl-tRNA(Asn)/glutamyl-tRNA(Gln) amidotransferase subunit B
MDIRMNYEAVIGLEVHAQMLTESKMFCGCSTKFGAEPNTQTCEICIGMPGILPVMNRKALEFTIRTGLSVQQIRTEELFLSRSSERVSGESV